MVKKLTVILESHNNFSREKIKKYLKKTLRTNFKNASIFLEGIIPKSAFSSKDYDEIERYFLERKISLPYNEVSWTVSVSRIYSPQFTSFLVENFEDPFINSVEGVESLTLFITSSFLKNFEEEAQINQENFIKQILVEKVLFKEKINAMTRFYFYLGVISAALENMLINLKGHILDVSAKIKTKEIENKILSSLLTYFKGISDNIAKDLAEKRYLTYDLSKLNENFFRVFEFYEYIDREILVNKRNELFAIHINNKLDCSKKNFFITGYEHREVITILKNLGIDTEEVDLS